MPIDYSQYHPKWSLISYLVRFVRAGNRCEWCGAVNYQPHPVTGSKVILTVAHIDHDKTNNRFSNLVALCQKCHLNHDMKQHVANRKYGRDYRGKHQLSLWQNRVTTAISLLLTAPRRCSRSGSSSFSFPNFGFWAATSGKKGGFGLKSVFSKPRFVVLQLLQIDIFLNKSEYSKGFEVVTRAPENAILVTNCYKVVTSCNIVLQTRL